MIVSTLMAASLALAPLQQEVPRPIQNQAEYITTVLITCRPVLDPVYWDAWLPLALNRGVAEGYISAAREVAASNPLPVTKTLCLSALLSALDKLDKLEELPAPTGTSKRV